MSNVKPIPEGYASVTPYLYLRGAAKAIEYYKKVFGATEITRMPGPGGRVMHAEIRIGNSMVMLADESPEMGALSPESLGGVASGLHVYLENVDAVVQKAIDAGGKILRPVQNQFYGDRSGMFSDPFGHRWNVGTHVEDVTPEEMKKRMAATSQAAGA